MAKNIEKEFNRFGREQKFLQRYKKRFMGLRGISGWKRGRTFPHWNWTWEKKVGNKKVWVLYDDKSIDSPAIKVRVNGSDVVNLKKLPRSRSLDELSRVLRKGFVERKLKKVM